MVHSRRLLDFNIPWEEYEQLPGTEAFSDRAAIGRARHANGMGVAITQEIFYLFHTRDVDLDALR